MIQFFNKMRYMDLTNNRQRLFLLAISFLLGCLVAFVAGYTLVRHYSKDTSVQLQDYELTPTVVVGTTDPLVTQTVSPTHETGVTEPENSITKDELMKRGEQAGTIFTTYEDFIEFYSTPQYTHIGNNSNVKFLSKQEENLDNWKRCHVSTLGVSFMIPEEALCTIKDARKGDSWGRIDLKTMDSEGKLRDLSIIIDFEKYSDLLPNRVFPRKIVNFSAPEPLRISGYDSIQYLSSGGGGSLLRYVDIYLSDYLVMTYWLNLNIKDDGSSVVLDKDFTEQLISNILNSTEYEN